MGRSNYWRKIGRAIHASLRIDYTTDQDSRLIIFSLFLTAAVTLIGKLYSDYLGLTNIGMLYLLPVIFAASRLGVRQSLFIALVSVLCWDVLFMPPILNLAVSDTRHLITFLVFMMVAYTTGNMSDLLRCRAQEATQREKQTRVLYELARGLSAAADLDMLVSQVVKQTAETLDAEAALFMPGHNGELRVVAANKTLTDLASSPNDLLAAQWTFSHSQPSGLGTDTFTGARGYHVPVKTEEKTMAVLAVKPSNNLLEAEQINLLQALAGLSALAIARLELAEEAHDVRTLEASERLQAALFNSISHDLKTPLTSIMSAVSSLVDDEAIYDEEQKATLLNGIKLGAERMNRFVNNLLDMARLESGYMKLNPDWSDIQDIIGVTLRENQEILKGHKVKVEIPDALPLIKVDYALIEQVLTNLLHNAVKYSPRHSEIIVSAAEVDGLLKVSVTDQGEGITPGDEEFIFDKFYRLQSPGNVSGTGLGLSICRGIIEAHGGTIWAAGQSERGSRFNFTLPVAGDVF
ncbi:MAG TPA: histidine kinase [Syntrophomonas sp.]|nr:histidine kinase [Syntrophomonas sp.]